jgi:hypothetical protein
VEIGGLAQVARGRRVFASLDRTDSSTHLELGLLLEDDRLFRQGETANTSIRGLLTAFRNGHHEENRPSSPACSNSPTRLEMRCPADACGRTSFVEHVAELLTASEQHLDRIRTERFGLTGTQR